tara:strand:+ start:422 stop:1051 length:630 start_codon:yes stop_codon:yes gene_type:complete
VPKKNIKQRTDQLANADAKSDPVAKIVSKVGRKLLNLRSEQSMSLQQLAAKSDVSGPAIHKIERSDMVPTITTLLKLSIALGVPVNYFIEDDEDLPEPICLTRSEGRGTVFTPHEGLFLEGISGPYQQFRAAAAFATMTAGANSGRKQLRHSGEELVHVISGNIEFSVGDTDHKLEAGDTLHFSGEVPHQWKNVTDESAKLIWVALRNE